MFCGSASVQLFTPYVVYKAQNLYEGWTREAPDGSLRFLQTLRISYSLSMRQFSVYSEIKMEDDSKKTLIWKSDCRTNIENSVWDYVVSVMTTNQKANKAEFDRWIQSMRNLAS